MKTSCGYGTSHYPERFERVGTTHATRIAWLLDHGRLPPDDMFVCHRCDNPPCVRPDHLFLGTSEDNVYDAIDKGRMACARPGR